MTPLNFLGRVFNWTNFVPCGDPGTAGTLLILEDRQTYKLKIAASASETRTLPGPQKSGLEIKIESPTVGGSGSAVVTVLDQAGSTTGTITFNAAGQWAKLISIDAAAGNHAWNVAGIYGASATVPGVGSTSYSVTTVVASSYGTFVNYVTVAGTTSGGIKIGPTATGAYLITITNTAQTSGAVTLTLPDFAGVADTFVFTTLAQTLVGKTLTAPVINGCTSASGNFNLSGSTGTFLTSSGANTLSGDVTVAAGKNLTLAVGAGYFQVNAATSGGIKLLPTASTGSLITVTTVAQTVGAVTLSIPNFASQADTFAFITLAQVLSNKTLAAPIISTGLTASGSAANDFSASTGTFLVSSGGFTNPGTVSNFGGAAGAATTAQRLIFKKAAITDNTATTVLNVTVPHTAVGAVLKLTILGAVTGYGSTRCAEGLVAITRVTGNTDTVAVAATLALAQIATSSAAETLTLAYSVASVTGANTGAQVVPIQVTLDTSASTSGEVVILAELVNASTGGATMAAA
jgi:hypothetical protein